MKMKRRSTAVILTAAMSLAFSMQAFAAAVGDVNADGKVSVADAVALSKYLTGQTQTLSDAAAADLNADGRLNVVDLTLLKRQILRGNTPSASGDNVVTMIQYGASAVTLLNANGEIVAAENADNVIVKNNTYVTITKPCEVDVEGECENGQLCIDVSKETYADGQVTCNLRGLTLANSKDSPVYVTSIGDEFVLTVKKDTVNTISDGTEYTNADGDMGAIYSCDDMKIKGKGKLIVNGKAADGIVCKNDLKIWNGDVTVNAVDDGIRGKDSVRIGDPDSEDDSALLVTVKAENGDGIRATGNGDDEGIIRLTNGTVDVTSFGDGISAQQTLEVNGGNIKIYTYQGSAFTGTAAGGNQGGGWGGFGMDGNSNKTEQSAKGLKASGITDDAGNYVSGGTISISGGQLDIDSSDDCVHCAGGLTITGGKLTLASADDALHCDKDLTLGKQGGAVSDFAIAVSTCYEGVEGQNIYQYAGTVVVNAKDDGYNAAGGADGSGNQNPGGWNQGGWGGFGGGGNNVMNLAGGLGIVNCADGDHDGFDSNGGISITGGYFISNGNEPFDCDGSKTYSGGVYIIDKGSGGGMGGMGGAELVSNVKASCSASANTRITLAETNGNVIVSFIADKAVTSLTAGCSDTPDAVFYTGGTVSGVPIETLDDTQTIYLSGTISGGTQASASSSTGGNQNPWGGR